MTQIEIGIGKSARRAYALDDVAIAPSKRTRAREDVDVSWRLDGYHLQLPVIAAAMDGVTSPAVCAEVGTHGGLGVLNLEGLWTRHADPAEALRRAARMDPDDPVATLRELYAAPVQPDLIGQRVAEMKETGSLVAGSFTPQRVEQWHRVALDAGLDVLVIEGTVVSAEHVSSSDEPLNLKDFIARYDIPVIVGGCTSYATALHLMRTGAAGVLVGIGSGSTSVTASSLGMGVPMASAIADAAGARSRHLEETGRSVQIIANGGIRTAGDIAKAIACGADAVMMGATLAAAAEAPAGGMVWGMAAMHETLPRGRATRVPTSGTLREILLGPTTAVDGRGNLVGGLRRALATAGFATLKEFQRAELVVRG